MSFLLCSVFLFYLFFSSLFSAVVLESSFFFFKQKTAYEILSGLVGSEMCIRDRVGALDRVVGVSRDMKKLHCEESNPVTSAVNSSIRG